MTKSSTAWLLCARRSNSPCPNTRSNSSPKCPGAMLVIACVISARSAVLSVRLVLFLILVLCSVVVHPEVSLSGSQET